MIGKSLSSFVISYLRAFVIGFSISDISFQKKPKSREVKFILSKVLVQRRAHESQNRNWGDVKNLVVEPFDTNRFGLK